MSSRQRFKITLFHIKLLLYSNLIFAVKRVFSKVSKLFYPLPHLSFRIIFSSSVESRIGIVIGILLESIYQLGILDSFVIFSPTHGSVNGAARTSSRSNFHSQCRECLITGWETKIPHATAWQ